MAVDQTAISAEIAARLATVNAAIDAATPLRTATPLTLAPVRTAVAGALTAIGDGIAALEGEIVTDSLAGVVTGTPAPVIWPVLMGQAVDIEQLTRLVEARSYLGRVAANLAGATG